MKDIFARIGDHLVAIKGEANILKSGIFRNLTIINHTNLKPDLFIHLKSGYGIRFQNYNVEIKKQKSKITFQRADYFIEADSNYQNAIISVHDELALKHALTNLYSSFIVHHNWGLLIHSSCVIEDGKALLFAGHSGAGKSTAAKLSSPRELLSDEATILKISQNEVTVFDSPFRSELETNGHNDELPLTGIHLLHQSSQIQRTEVKKSDALLNVLDKVFYWSHDQEETRQVLHLLKTLIQSVPVYDLYFQKNNKFWELIST